MNTYGQWFLYHTTNQACSKGKAIGYSKSPDILETRQKAYSGGVCMNLGPNSPFWAVFFWINVAVCSILAIVVVRVVRKYEAKRKQLEKNVKTPGFDEYQVAF